MKVKTLSALAGLGGAMILSGTAQADYTGLSVVSTTQVIGANTRTIHRLYANFTDPTDMVTTWGGDSAGAFGTATINQLNAAGSGPGSGFFNGPGGGGASFTPPTQELIDSLPAAQWDSFYTINATIADQVPDPTNAGLLTQGMPNIATGSTSISITNGAITTTPTLPNGNPNPLAQAGWAGDGDPGIRVLLAQFQVANGEHVAGTIGLVVFGGVAGAGQAIGGQTFTSVPAPGALALLGLAGLVGSRRRRA